MKIIVCIKQVPSTNNVNMNPDTGTLIRINSSAKMNPYDLYAIETAMIIKESVGGTVTALTMGPPRAEHVIREAYCMGVDYGVLLSDIKLAGADAYNTAYALAGAVKFLRGFDLIICGQQTTDGDTAQVGSELAEILNIPGVASVAGLREVERSKVNVCIDMGEEIFAMELSTPCLISVNKDICQPRLPSYLKKKKRLCDAVQIINIDDLPDKDKSHYGINGSPTQVIRIFQPKSKQDQVLVTGTPHELAEKLFLELRSQNYLNRRQQL